MLDVLQVVIFGLGCISIGLAINYIRFFRRSRHHIAGSMQALLAEQITSSIGTMLFAANSLLATLTGVPPEHWNSIPPEAAIAIRAVMFIAMIHATVRISVSVRRVLHE